MYCPIQYRGTAATSAAVHAIRKAIRSIDKAEISINIAGNGLYTLNERWDVAQEDLDRYTFELLRAALSDPCGKKITVIRSGGQTGFDEAGIKAGMSLGIPTEILAPQGWKLRNVHGVDVMDELAFKRRFVLHQMKLEWLSKSFAWSTYCYDNDDECAGWNAIGIVRNRAGHLVMEHLTPDQADELSGNVHAYFSYVMVMLDVRGCTGYREMFQVTFDVKGSLQDFKERVHEATQELIDSAT